MGVRDQFELSAPRRQEVDPPLTFVRAPASGGSAEDPNTPRLKVTNCQIEVLDVQGDVMAPVIAVAWKVHPLVGGLVLEDLEDGRPTTSEEPDLLGDRTGMHVEVGAHPVAIVGERAERVEVLAPENIDEERGRLFDVRHGEPDVVETRKPGQTRSSFSSHGHHCTATYLLSVNSSMPS